MTKHAILFVTVCAIAVNGCSENATPTSNAPSTNAAESPTSFPSEEEFPRTTAAWDKPDGHQSGSSSNGVNPAIVELQFQKIDWTNPAFHPSLELHLTPDSSLTIKGSPQATESSKKMVAIWRRPEQESTGVPVVVIRQSRPLENSEQALALLTSFTNRDRDFQSSVEWTATARSSASTTMDFPKTRD